MNTPASVFVIDDDAEVRNALALLLQTAGHSVAQFAGAEEFLDTYTSDLRGCLILDVNMPGMDGPALHEELLQRGAQLPVIFLSAYGTIPVSVRAIKAGAVDFLTKPVDGAALLASVREALQQHALWRKQLEDSLSVTSRLKFLTDREREIMIQVIAGHTSKEIAQCLGISHRTVEIHRAHILQKTGVANLLELARLVDQVELPLLSNPAKPAG